MTAIRPRTLKTVTGADIYNLELDQEHSTLDTVIRVAELAAKAAFDALFVPDLLRFAAQGTIGTPDHLSNGRAAWNLVISAIGEENYGAEEPPSPEDRYTRAAETLDVVHAFWDSRARSTSPRCRSVARIRARAVAPGRP
jgi:alkanesulfonate monooxygenase SsuD/methylene tetrahydromethanopterin reductase-like flavin-dependent oxidoreductase (luciferase family)